MTLADNVEKVSALIQQLLEKVPLNELSDVVIFGSSAIALNGRDLERLVDDLDLFASETDYERLKKARATEEITKAPGVTALHVGISKIEIWKTFPGVVHSEVRQHAMPTARSHGLLVAALDNLTTWKRAQGRPKDLEDLKKLGFVAE